MTSPWIWAILFGVFVAVIGGLDLVCVLMGRPSLSSWVIGDSRLYPLIPFFTGLIIGLLAHHFWGAR